VDTLLISELLRCALAAATSGANELASRYGKELQTSVKTSAEDLVTNADLASEAKVREVISSLRPEDAITGEELEAFESLSAKVRWSIDPLDGTVNYTRGIPYFATSVGACDIESGVWLAGAVIAPALGITYFAAKGQGATRIDATGERKLSGPDSARMTKIVATGFSYQDSDRVKQFQLLSEVMTGYVDVRRMGSAALDICMVADGTFDAFYEHHLKEHDWAAGMLIAEEAGITVKRPEFVGDVASANFH
jgi:myo-inositol-1(or 4)-monophosphatase